MLKLDKSVNRGILFIRVEGDLTTKTIPTFYNELKYLLYNQGMHYYVFNFEELHEVDNMFFSQFQNLLTEIYSNFGKVALCGIEKKRIKLKTNSLFYITNELEAYKYLRI